MNAATCLANMLDSWVVTPGTSVLNVRRDAIGIQDMSQSFWREMTYAFELIREIESAIDGLAAQDLDVGVWRYIVPSLYSAVYEPDIAWQQGVDQSNREPLAPAMMVMLRMLASYLEQVGLPEQVEPGRIDELIRELDAVAQMIVGEVGLSIAVKGYLLGLVNEAQWVLANLDVYGGATLRRATHALSGALADAAESDAVPEERRSAWRAAARAVVVYFVAPIAIAAGGVAGTAIGTTVVHAVESGGGGNGADQAPPPQAP